MSATIEIDLDGAAVALEGDRNPIAEAAFKALLMNGGVDAGGKDTPDILLVSCPLLPSDAEPRPLLGSARRSAETMAGRGGRIVFLVSALAGMPMRRHPQLSADMAAILAGMRVLAMEFGPRVLVNAVGFGPIAAETMVSGDRFQLDHVPLSRTGTIDEAVAAVLFLCDPENSYTTGQMLSVDGGWTAGYGRNF